MKWIIFAVVAAGTIILAVVSLDPSFFPSLSQPLRLLFAGIVILSGIIVVHDQFKPPAPRLIFRRVIVVSMILILVGSAVYLAFLKIREIPRVSSNEEWLRIRGSYEWKRSFEGIEMVLVPPGSFVMGNTGIRPNESPENEQIFDVPFWIDLHEVTIEQSGGDNDNLLPRVFVTWSQARDHCESRGARLPTEREWEYAARGPDGWTYPWTGDFVETNTIGISVGRVAQVGSRPNGASWVGAMDMTGNVWELVSTIYDEELYPYPYDGSDGRENLDDSPNTLRVLRGGSYMNNETELRATYRSWIGGGAGRDEAIGFRCVRDYND